MPDFLDFLRKNLKGRNKSVTMRSGAIVQEAYNDPEALRRTEQVSVPVRLRGLHFTDDGLDEIDAAMFYPNGSYSGVMGYSRNQNTEDMVEPNIFGEGTDEDHYPYRKDNTFPEAVIHPRGMDRETVFHELAHMQSHPNRVKKYGFSVDDGREVAAQVQSIRDLLRSPEQREKFHEMYPLQIDSAVNQYSDIESKGAIDAFKKNNPFVKSVNLRTVLHPEEVRAYWIARMRSEGVLPKTEEEFENFFEKVDQDRELQPIRLIMDVAKTHGPTGRRLKAMPKQISLKEA